MSTKWFYECQNIAEGYLKTLYGDNYSCNWQNITKDRVIEHFTVWPKDEQTSKEVILIYVYKGKIAKPMIFGYDAKLVIGV